MNDVAKQQVSAVRDQAWAAMRDRHDQIKRIALYGPDGSKQDSDLVRMVCFVVSGELHFMASQVDEVEGTR